MVRLIHTADLHLDTTFSSRFSKEEAEERRQGLLLAWNKLLDFGAEKRVQAVLIAGDLFDSPVVSRSTMDIFLSSIIVLNAILLIVRQVTGKEMELFSFLAIENDSGPILIIRLLLEIVISLAILVKATGIAKFRKDLALFGSAFIATQALMDYPGAISQLVRYNLWRGILFTLLYLVVANLACREWRRTTEGE